LKTHFIRELEANQVVTSYFIVHSKEVRLKKTGEPYLNLILADRTGVLDAKMWDGVAEILEKFERDDFVKVKGLVQVFRNKPQMTVHKLRRLDDQEVDFGDYFPHTERNVNEMWAELRAAVSGMQNEHLRGLVDAFLDDEEIAARFRQAPAAKSLHHARIGGLLEHVMSLAGLCKRCAGHYPFVDADLLLTGIVLHDLGKVFELHYQRAFGYTTEGQLLGHMVIVLNLLQAKIASVPGFPPKLKILVEHMILSHHGHYEFGSPKLPMFPEALFLHYLDDMDSKMESMRASLAGDQNIEGEWTSFNPSLERTLLKKEKFLAEPKAQAPAAASQAPKEPAEPVSAPALPEATATPGNGNDNGAHRALEDQPQATAPPPNVFPTPPQVPLVRSVPAVQAGGSPTKPLHEPQTLFGERLKAALKPDARPE